MKGKNLLLFMIILISGCQNTIYDECNDNSTNECSDVIMSIVEVENKASLRFASQNAFEQCINSLNGDGDLNLDNVTRSTELEFVSLKQTIQEKYDICLTEQDYETITSENLEYENEDSIIADPKFLSLLNEDRVIVIDTTIYKYVDSGVLIGNVNDIKEFETVNTNTLPKVVLRKGEYYPISDNVTLVGLGNTVLQELKDESNNNSNEMYKIGDDIQFSIEDIKFISYAQSESEANDFQRWLSGLFGTNVVVNNYFDDSHRMRVRLFSQDYLIYSSVGMSVRFQKKILGLWWRASADEFRYGWQNVEIQTKYSSSFIPQVTIRETTPPIQTYPEVIKGPFLYSKEDLILYYINSDNYDIVSKNIMDVYLKSINSIKSKISKFIQSFPKFANAKAGIYVPYDESRTVRYLIPWGETVATDKGRDIVTWDYQ